MAEKVLSEEELATYPPFPDWSPVAIRKLLHSHELLRSQLAAVEAERDGLKRENSEIRTENARLGASLENCYSAIERLKREVQDEQTIFKWERDRVQKLLVENDGLKRDAERWKQFKAAFDELDFESDYELRQWKSIPWPPLESQEPTT